jgi:hypothetical protein
MDRYIGDITDITIISDDIELSQDPFSPEALSLMNENHGPDGRFSEGGGSSSGARNYQEVPKHVADAHAKKHSGIKLSQGSSTSIINKRIALMQRRKTLSLMNENHGPDGRFVAGGGDGGAVGGKDSSHDIVGDASDRAGDASYDARALSRAANYKENDASKHYEAAKAHERAAKAHEDLHTITKDIDSFTAFDALRTAALHRDLSAQHLKKRDEINQKRKDDHAASKGRFKSTGTRPTGSQQRNKVGSSGKFGVKVVVPKLTQQKAGGFKAIGFSHEAVALDIISEHMPWELANTYTDKLGIVHHLYRKPVLRTGDFVKESDGLKFKVTDATLSHFEKTFNEMKENNIAVSVPMGHTTDADKQHGKIVRFEKRGEFLDGIFDMVGANAPELVATNDVSIYAPPEFVDGEGRRYVRPITHVALTPCPVIPGLGEWESVAASFQKENVFMKWDSFKKALGIEAELTDANAESLLIPAIEKIKGEKESLSLSLNPTKTAKAVVDIVVENRKMKLDNLVAGGRLTPACRDKIFALEANPAVLELSLSNGKADHFNDLIAILAENDTVSLKEHTGAQGVKLSQDSENKDKKNPMTEAMDKIKADAEERKKATGGKC